MPTPTLLNEKAVAIGKLACRMTARAGAGHASSALSLAHLVTHLMYRQMRYDPGDPWNPNGDRLVLSEGHAVPIIYAAYADLGGVVGRKSDRREQSDTLTLEALDTLRARDSVLDGHPNPAEGFPFFDAATGSLGMGLSVSAGLALAARLSGSPRRIYCIIGDGESREGQIWEAADFVVDHKLTSVVAIFNCNGQGQAAYVSPQQSAERVAAKLTAFGWEVASINGHDVQEIEQAFARVGQTAKPLAVVARTIKGWGADLLQSGNWHGKPPKETDLPAIYASLDKTLASQPRTALVADRPPAPAGVSAGKSHAAIPAADNVTWPSFEDAMTAAGLGDALKKNALATRRAYGVALKVAGDLLPQVVALDGDVSNSTFTEIFARAHADRFFECKIAEQNMISAAVGLSAGGRIAFANTFAKFVARAYDQVEIASISRANIKIVGSHAGVTPCSDGPSQMALLDVGYFRGFTTVRGDDRQSPSAWIFQPCDARGAYHCTRLMLELHGLCYMRTFRPDSPVLYPPDTRFEPGGHLVPRWGEDVALISSGYMVHIALAAADLLRKQNVRAAVVDCYSLPFKARGDDLLDTLQRCGRRGLVVEDNYGGGVGSAIAELAARRPDLNLRIESLHVQRIPKSTREPAEELDLCGISPAQIADQARALLGRT